ncbi:cilia- and flagella-associated protein 52 [Antennarius striatus]|uniref:cilia- and flagella-associated protein 52 n=1 Tax=Antennarius striatus TaxID=241820 RepID=UPI0035B2AFEC
MSLDSTDVPQIELEAVIGFTGHVPSGLWVHPDSEHLIYPLGHTIILKTIKDGKQEFLHGHTNNVSCISVSKSGSYIASGQVDFLGFEAKVIIWDYAQRTIYAQLLLHKEKVEALAFSPNEKYLVSLGGQHDGRVAVWNIETKRAICESPASARSAGQCLTVQYSNTNDYIFVSAGSETLVVWRLDLFTGRIEPKKCQIGKLRRTVNCVEIDQDDQFIFCGTTSGDFLKINLESGFLTDCSPVKTKFSLGVNALKIVKSGKLLVGSGCGMLSLCSHTNFKILKQVPLEKGVTSIALRGEGHQFFVGTKAAQIYRFSYDDFKADLISTSHTDAVKDIDIAFGSSEIFATCSGEDIRVWCIGRHTELLRITVPNVTCNCLHIMADGHGILSAWSDKKIQMFAPESGRPMLVIEDAHRMSVTAITGTRSCKRIISGSGEGQVHFWELHPGGHRLLKATRGHTATITCIKIKSDDKECVSASCDGTCIIWDLKQFVSLQTLNANTQVWTVCYHPEEYHIITSGNDRKITYWGVYDSSTIRKLEASQSGSNSVDISQDGKHFVTGGDDKQLKVWDYNEGVVTHVGMLHSSSITGIKICSNNRTLISTGADGAIYQWRFPHPSSS